MGYIVPSDVKNRFPQFADVDDSVIQTYIDDTECNFDISRWDCHYTRGHSLYVAHLMNAYRVDQGDTGIGSGAGGPKNSESADGVTRSYSVYSPANASESFLMTSQYGAEYITLRNQVGKGAIALCSN